MNQTTRTAPFILKLRHQFLASSCAQEHFLLVDLLLLLYENGPCTLFLNFLQQFLYSMPIDKTKCVIVLTDDDGKKKTVSRQGETVCQICDLNYYWHFVLILLARYLFICILVPLWKIYIDHSTKSIFSIQLRRIIRNFFYFFFLGYLSLLTGGCCLKGKLTGPFPY